MTYLEKMIKQTLANHNYELASDVTLSSVAEQIDRTNECEDGLYDVNDWIRDTKRNYPENLISLYDVTSKLVPYLAKQINDCYDQTGCYPNIEDYALSLQADNSPMKNVDLATLIRLLIVLINH